MSNRRNLGLHEINPDNAVDTEALEDEMVKIKDILEEHTKLVEKLVTEFTRKLSDKDEEIKRLNQLLADKSAVIGRLEATVEMGNIRPRVVYNPQHPNTTTIQAGYHGHLPQRGFNVGIRIPSNDNHEHLQHTNDRRNY